MIPAPIASIVTPDDRARVLASVKHSADFGRELADLAALMFGIALPADLRAVLEASLRESLPEVVEDWPLMAEEHRAHLFNVAAVVFDRRLAIHAAGGQFQGGQA